MANKNLDFRGEELFPRIQFNAIEGIWQISSNGSTIEIRSPELAFDFGRLTVPRQCQPPSDDLSRSLQSWTAEAEAWEAYRLTAIRYHKRQTAENLQAALEAHREWEATPE